MRPHAWRTPVSAGAALTFLLLGFATESVAAPLTLGEARRRALANLPSVEEARERVAASRLRRGSAGRMANPTLGLAVENFGLGLGGDRRETTVELGQRLELGGDRGARAAVADAAIEAAGADQVAVMRDVIAQVDGEFIAAWSLQERAQIQRAFVELAESFARVAQARHTAGAAPRGEVLRATADASLRRAEHRRTLTERDVTFRRLEALIGPEGGIDSLALDAPDSTALATGAGGSLAARQPEQRRAEAAVRLAEAQVRLARSARTPDFDLGFGVRRLEEAGASGFLVGVGTTLPFWNSGGGDVAAADAEARAARQRVRGVTRSLEIELAGARGRFAAALAYERSLREDVRPAVASALEQIEVAYRAGRASGLEPIEARRALRDVELALVDARGDVARAQAELGRWIESAEQGVTRPGEGR